MSKISGPVSMYYLKPISNDIPLILLFGDHHFSHNKMCPTRRSSMMPYSNKEGSKENVASFEIYSPYFLKKLDRLATPSRPIDFYVEYFDDSDDTGTFDSPLDKFRGPFFQPCYKKTMKKGSKCPAPNIRWHYSDIRLSKMKNNIEHIFDSIYVFTQFCEAVNRKGQYEGVSINTWLEISDCIHYRQMKFDNNLVEQFLGERPDFRVKRANIGYHIIEFYKKYTGIDVGKIAQMRQIVQVLASDQLSQEIIELIFGYTNATANQSLIYKQFVKQDKKRVFGYKDFIVDTMRESLERKLTSEHVPPDEDALEHLSNFDITYNKYEEVARLLLHVNSTFVDIYTILRMMKGIDRPPSLCVGYFGNSHVLNLVEILLGTGYYKKEYFVEEHRENRCLPFEIDLLGDLSMKRSSSKKRSKRRLSSTHRDS